MTQPLVEYWHYVFSALVSLLTLIGLAYRFAVVPVRTYMAEMRAQFGGNSGGIRQAVNEMADQLSHVARRVEFLQERVRLSAMQDANCGQWDSDATGSCIYASPTMTLMTGWPASFWLGDNWIGALHEDDRDRVTDAWLSAVRQKRRFEMTYTFQTSIGMCIQVHARATPVIDDDGALLGYVGEFCRVSGPTDCLMPKSHQR